ncbi:MAG: hypothetical protein R3F19_13855 [Verrucomicrobiales bacterium]
MWVNAAPEDNDRVISLKMADQSSWHLRYRDDSRPAQDWVRIAKCLQGAYSSGVTSWGPCRTTPLEEKAETRD